MNSPLAHTVTTPEPTPRSPEVLDARTGWEPAVVSVRELMTSSEVAAVLRVSQATGTGPRVLWLSARVPRYLWRDVEDWMERSRS
jgi:hypothetical protein